MLLNQLVSAILNDLTRAQDLANEYSSQLSRKYNKYQSEKDNLLDNYQVPSGILHEIELDLKFAIETLSQNKLTFDLDNIGTYDNCERLAKEIITEAKTEIKELINHIGVPQSSSETTVSLSSLPTLTSREQSQSSDPQDERQQAIKFWHGLKTQLEEKEYIQFYITKLTEFIFHEGKNEFSRSKKWISETDLKDIIYEALYELVIDNDDFSYLLKTTKEAFNKTDEEIEQWNIHLATKFHEIAKKYSTSPASKSLLVQLSGIPNTEIIVAPSVLKDIPIEMISTLKIKAGLQSYRWIIGEGGTQNLQKVKD
ncbi:MAG: hypothetical protein RMX96_24620 [Nostoc sp. ChiSLP02]|nr:hypothetical protein [Nostoc sp. DedSLP05]MDZ8103226.1 hypothetical protein [Nostoc sp. DedSLP01]MDZ8188023.1 hypothetical protein [Nostoc sp. ChiSLP02]